MSTLYTWKKEKIDALLSEFAEKNEKLQHALDANEEDVQYGANRNFQSLRAKLSNSVSVAISSMIKKNIKVDEQVEFLQGS